MSQEHKCDCEYCEACRTVPKITPAYVGPPAGGRVVEMSVVLKMPKLEAGIGEPKDFVPNEELL